MYQKYNPNPSKLKASDCVIRAICVVTGYSWERVYEDLVNLGFRMHRMPNEVEVYGEYLASLGMKRAKLRIEKGSKRPTVASFAKEHQSGVYVLKVANHVVGVRDGIYYDTWDSGKNSLYTYWYR